MRPSYSVPPGEENIRSESVRIFPDERTRLLAPNPARVRYNARMSRLSLDATSEATSASATLLRVIDRTRRRLLITRIMERAVAGAELGALAGLSWAASVWFHLANVYAATSFALLPPIAVALALVLLHRPRLSTPPRFRFLLTPTSRQAAFPAAAPLIATLAATAAVAGALIRLWAVDRTWPHAVLPVAATVAGALIATVSARPISRRRSAIYLDRHLATQEQIATALEWAGLPSQSDPGFRAPLINRAATASAAVDQARLPLRLFNGWLEIIAAILILLMIAALQLAPLPAPVPGVIHGMHNELVAQTADTLTKKLAELEKDHAIPKQGGDHPVDALRQVAEQLRQGNADKMGALTDLQAAEKDLKDQSDQLAAAEKARDALQSDPQTSDLLHNAESQHPGTDGAGQSDKGGGSPSNPAGTQPGKSGAKNAGSSLAGSSQASRDKLSQSLNKAAQAAAGNSGVKSALEKAADAAQKNDQDALNKAMADAAGGMNSGGMSQDEIKQALQAAGDAEHQLGSSAAEEAGGKQQQQMAGGNSGGSNGANGQQGSDGNQGGDQGGQQNGDQSGSQNGQGGQQSAGGQQGNQGGQQGGQKGGESAGGSQAGGSQSASAGGQSNGAGNEESTDGGSTNLKQMGAPGEHNHGGVIGKQGTFVKLYESRDNKNAGSTNQLQAKINKGQAAGTTEVMGRADNTESTIRYQDAISAAKAQAQDAITDQKIPPQYRDVVRHFYDDTPAATQHQ
jgi:hypothetical protein